jgi:uncharacterized membrane protein (DUF106 family)
VNAVNTGVNSIASILKPYKFDDSEMQRLQKEQREQQQEKKL